MFFMTCFKIDMLLDSIYKTKYENTTNIEYICEKNELSPKIFEGFYINPKKSISINSSGIINYYDLNISCTCDYAKDFVEKMSQNTYMEHCINKTYFLKHKIQIFNPGNKLIFVVKNWPLLAYKERKLNMVVSSNDGILIFDIKNPVNPVLSQRLNEHKNVRRAYVSTNKLFLIDNSEKILIFDSNISSTVPQIWDFKKYISDISVIAGRAYVASNENGLLIFDISDSSNLTQIGNFDTKGNAIDVYVKDYYAYIAEGEYGIEIVDISDPITPILIENFDTLLNKAMNVFLKDNYLFVGDGNYLLIYDISSPLNPVQLGHYEIDSQIVDIYIEDDYAYIASTSNGITILNISDPRYPKFVKKNYQDFRIFSISGL
ncbi:LVIVD repeat protein [Thermosipho africanus H17ap60334]|nr:LVIVD repeat protein [Thermosipho africanus H17ap60334]